MHNRGNIPLAVIGKLQTWQKERPDDTHHIIYHGGKRYEFTEGQLVHIGEDEPQSSGKSGIVSRISIDEKIAFLDIACRIAKIPVGKKDLELILRVNEVLEGQGDISMKELCKLAAIPNDGSLDY